MLEAWRKLVLILLSSKSILAILKRFCPARNEKRRVKCFFFKKSVGLLCHAWHNFMKLRNYEIHTECVDAHICRNSPWSYAPFELNIRSMYIVLLKQFVIATHRTAQRNFVHVHMNIHRNFDFIFFWNNLEHIPKYRYTILCNSFETGLAGMTAKLFNQIHVRFWHWTPKFFTVMTIINRLKCVSDYMYYHFSYDFL